MNHEFFHEAAQGRSSSMRSIRAMAAGTSRSTSLYWRTSWSPNSINARAMDASEPSATTASDKPCESPRRAETRSTKPRQVSAMRIVAKTAGRRSVSFHRADRDGRRRDRCHDCRPRSEVALITALVQKVNFHGALGLLSSVIISARTRRGKQLAGR